MEVSLARLVSLISYHPATLSWLNPDWLLSIIWGARYRQNQGNTWSRRQFGFVYPSPQYSREYAMSGKSGKNELAILPMWYSRLNVFGVLWGNRSLLLLSSALRPLPVAVWVRANVINFSLWGKEGENRMGQAAGTLLDGIVCSAIVVTQWYLVPLGCSTKYRTWDISANLKG